MLCHAMPMLMLMLRGAAAAAAALHGESKGMTDMAWHGMTAQHSTARNNEQYIQMNRT